MAVYEDVLDGGVEDVVLETTQPEEISANPAGDRLFHVWQQGRQIVQAAIASQSVKVLPDDRVGACFFVGGTEFVLDGLETTQRRQFCGDVVPYLGNELQIELDDVLGSTGGGRR